MPDPDGLQRQATTLVAAAVKTLTHPDKRRRVALRRALGRAPQDPAVRAAHLVVAPVLPQSCDEATERAFYSVAAMIAAQPREARDQTASRTNDEDKTNASAPDADEAGKNEKQESLGVTLGRAVATGKQREDTTESRLHLMCRQNTAGIHRHLPRLIATLRADLVRVDWVRLTVDLSRWGRERDLVTKKWLQDYYRTLHAVRAAREKNASTSEGEDQ
ncbi:type I-E CRISPR-associated protein Cse2/CasB [Nonomuraea sp. 3N208]|uniref:type I-E CRISPR-associated protein Cse2/CasB n=1 Tax=Nonomuraea sp. 3N208 TaxID=3457421 RepID=UPI003FD1BC64